MPLKDLEKRREFDRNRKATIEGKEKRKVHDAKYRETHNTKDYHKQYYLDNKKKINEQNNAWYYANREEEIKKRVISNRKRQYGMTPEMIEQMLASQNGCCAICRDDKPGGRGHWHIDHDHETGQVRGLLCQRCNSGLGFFRDNITILEGAINYLHRESLIE